MNTIKVDRQFVSEYEEVYNQLGYYPRDVVIPCVTVHQTYARMHNEVNFFEEA